MKPVVDSICKSYFLEIIPVIFLEIQILGSSDDESIKIFHWKSFNCYLKRDWKSQYNAIIGEFGTMVWWILYHGKLKIAFMATKSSFINIFCCIKIYRPVINAKCPLLNPKCPDIGHLCPLLGQTCTIIFFIFGHFY